MKDEELKANDKHTIWVFHRLNLVMFVQVLKQWGEYPPARVKLIVTNKVGVIAFESVQDERFISLGNLEVRKSSAVCKIELSHDSLHAQPGKLGVHLDVDALVWLHPNYELIAWNVFEDA